MAQRRKEPVRRDRWWAFGLVLLAAWVIVQLALRQGSGDAWRPVLAGGVVYAVLFVGTLAYRRWREARGTAVDTGDDIAALDRHIMAERVPEDPSQREALRRLMRRRRRQIDWGRPWAVPLATVCLLALGAMRMVSGRYGTGTLTVVVAVVYGLWTYWYQRRASGRLDRLEKRLAGGGRRRIA